MKCNLWVGAGKHLGIGENKFFELSFKLENVQKPFRIYDFRRRSKDEYKDRRLLVVGTNSDVKITDYELSVGVRTDIGIRYTEYISQ